MLINSEGAKKGEKKREKKKNLKPTPACERAAPVTLRPPERSGGGGAAPSPAPLPLPPWLPTA